LPRYSSHDELMVGRVARAKARLKAPWKPIETAPKDKHEIVVTWLDDLGTYNVDFAWWQPGEECFLHRNGMYFSNLVGWMPRMKLPGTPRHP
jgi:hypothetical protein